MDQNGVAALDVRAARAVPPEFEIDVAGWIARRTAGLTTKRANSVYPQRHTPADWLEEKIIRCERVYGDHGLPTRFQISPASQPETLTTALIGRGYAPLDPTLVQTCSLDRLRRAERGHAFGIAIATGATAPWWQAWTSALRVDEPRRRAVASLFERLTRPTLFVVVSIDGIPVSTALGVIDDPWLGIFNMATALAYRGRGAARTALESLVAVARERGASHGYLQVDQANQRALALYQGAGFREAYRYVYLTRDPVR